MDVCRAVILAFVTYLTLRAEAQSQFRYEGYLESGGTPVTAAAQRFTVTLRKPGCADSLGLPAWDSGATIAINNGEFNLVPQFNEALLSVAMDPNQLFGCAAGSARNLEITWEDQARTFVVSLQDAPRSSFSNLAGNSNSLSNRTGDQFLKIDTYAGQAPISVAGVNTLLSLISGASTVYSRPADPLGGDLAGTIGTGAVVGIRGRAVSPTVPTTGQVLKYNGTSWVPSADDTGGAPVDASYAAKGVVQLNTSEAVSGLSVTSGVVSLPNTITAAGPIGNSSTVPVITFDAKGRLTAVTTATVDDPTKLALTGDTMTGPLDMGLQNITNANSMAATTFSGRNLILNDNDTNLATLRAPINLTTNYTLTLPTTAPTSGFVLSTSGSGQLSWVAAATGAVTTVSATSPILSSGGTAPVISLDTGLTANRVPQVGGTALGANGVIVANGLGTALSSLNCASDQVIKFDASGFALCAADSVSVGTEFMNNGNTFAANATIGTNDAFPLNFETNGTTQMTVLTNGNVGIGTTTPSAKLTVSGTATSVPNIIASGSSADLSLSNVHLFQSVGGSNITLSNISNGASYTLIISDTSQRTYTFPGCTNSYFSPTNGQTFMQSTYSILAVVVGGNTNCYINWVTGFN